MLVLNWVGWVVDSSSTLVVVEDDRWSAGGGGGVWMVHRYVCNGKNEFIDDGSSSSSSWLQDLANISTIWM